jgi:hypothetical protein
LWYSVNFIKADRASRGAHAAQALALRERLRCASDSLILGILGNLGHFRHSFIPRILDAETIECKI